MHFRGPAGHRRPSPPGGFRRGEILGLRRRDVNEVAGAVAIERSPHEFHTGEVVYGPPESKAGARFKLLPKPAMATLLAHLDSPVAARFQAPLLSSTTGDPMRPRFLESEWRRARRLVGLEHVSFTTSATSIARCSPPNVPPRRS